jgi:hypothetical protein
MEAVVTYFEGISVLGGTGENNENLTRESRIWAEFRENGFFRVP